MDILLGDLSVADMQRRAGVEFPTELVEFLSSRHQPQAANVAAGKWHCFDVPFVLVCGDVETATEVVRHLEPLSSQFSEQLGVSVTA